jgi:hypothetical protein
VGAGIGVLVGFLEDQQKRLANTRGGSGRFAITRDTVYFVVKVLVRRVRDKPLMHSNRFI